MRKDASWLHLRMLSAVALGRWRHGPVTSLTGAFEAAHGRTHLDP